MKLSDTGEARIRGYLFVFERSLRSFLSAAVATDAVREVDSHIRERLDGMDTAGDERGAIERVLAELGTPLRVAQAYSQEMTLDEAGVTGRLVPTMRALWYGATTAVVGSAWATLVFTGWSLGLSFLALPILKPIFPENVGFVMVNGQFHGLGAHFPMPPGGTVVGGYWFIPLSILAGLAVLAATQWTSRRILVWMRANRLRARMSADTRLQ